MIDVTPNHVSAEFMARIPRDFAREYLVISQGVSSSSSASALTDPANVVERVFAPLNVDPIVLHNVSVRVGREIEVVNCENEEVLARVIDAAYAQFARDSGCAGTHEAPTTDESTALPGQDNPGNGDFDGSIDLLLARADRELLSTGGKGPIVRLIDRLLFEALGERASDLHIQPLADRALVRYRIDGALHDRHEFTARVTAAIVSRIKVMGQLDIAERRMPQDGRAAVTIAGRPVDLRISTIPTSYGERAVVRLLDHSRQLCSFDQLGMPADVASAFSDCATGAQGIILVTGPTGSGKTTTLYSTLRAIASSEQNVMTIEDPIEYELSDLGTAISQAQVNSRKGITFATGLRHILRQDPDIIMVGEIRDLETARMAIQSSLTGHLVFSTLHTNDAPSAVTRMMDLGVEPYLVGASLSAVLAQRLVRRVHGACAGQGCTDCLQTGLFGRIGLFELMLIDEEIRMMINHRSPIGELRTQAQQNGMRLLHAEGKRLAESGVTTAQAIRSVVLASERTENFGAALS